MKTVYTFKKDIDYSIVSSISSTSGNIGISILNNNFKKLLQTNNGYLSIIFTNVNVTGVNVSGGCVLKNYVYEQPNSMNGNLFVLYLNIYGASRFNTAAQSISSIDFVIGEN